MRKQEGGLMTALFWGLVEGSSTEREDMVGS
jgi:hypothetical protein